MDNIICYVMGAITMGIYGLNIVGIFVAAIVAMVVGMLWYSPKLFGNKWISYVGFSKKKIKEAKEEGMTKQLIIAFIAQLCTATLLSIFMSYAGATNIFAGVLIAVLLWLGFAATNQINVVLWERKPWGLFLVNTGHTLFNLVLMAIVLQLFI